MEIFQTRDCNLIAKLTKDVQDLHVALYPEYFKTYDFEGIAAFFETVVNRPEHFIFAVSEHKGPVGYIWAEIRIYPDNVFKKSYRSMFVHSICIVSSSRRRGLGTALMNKIYEIAKTENIRTVELDYWALNKKTEEFYDHQGFSPFRIFVHKEMIHGEP